MFVLLQYFSVGGALVIHSVIQGFSHGFRVAFNYRYINWRIFTAYTIGDLMAFSLFLLISMELSKQVVLLSLGAFAVFTPFLKYSPVNVQNRRTAGIMGFIIGSTQYATGVAGPLFNIIFLSRRLCKEEVIATKSAISLFSLGLKTIYFLPLYLRQDMPQDLIVVAPLLVIHGFMGTQWAQRTRKGIGEKNFLRTGKILVSLMGIVCLWKGVSW